MKEVLISIQPKWCELIANGTKTVEVRKTKPKLNTPFKCYIYCTLPPKEELLNFGSFREYANELIRLQDGLIVYDYGMRVCCDIEGRPYSQDNFLCKKVIGEFVCNQIDDITIISTPMMEYIQANGKASMTINSDACLDIDELSEYANGKTLYGWHISDLVIYDKPKDIGEFYKGGMLSYDDWLYGIYNGNGGARSSYESYKNAFKLSKAPQSWCYVKGEKE